MSTKVTWKCTKCCSIQSSYSSQRWNMTVCSCGESMMDLEEGYSRESGHIERISTEPYGNKENGASGKIELW